MDVSAVLKLMSYLTRKTKKKFYPDSIHYSIQFHCSGAHISIHILSVILSIFYPYSIQILSTFYPLLWLVSECPVLELISFCPDSVQILAKTAKSLFWSSSRFARFCPDSGQPKIIDLSAPVQILNPV